MRLCATLSRPVQPSLCAWAFISPAARTVPVRAARSRLEGKGEARDRGGPRHEHGVAVAAGAGDGGRALGQCEEADRFGSRMEQLYAVERAAHASGAPQIAGDVDPKAVGRFF